MKKILLLHLFAFLLFSCQSKKNKKSLIDNFSFNIPLVNDIDDLLGMNVRTIQLDTLTKALVGYVNKIIKHENSFYILSDGSRILHFDYNGNFISSLDKKGGGPGEYTMLADFSVCNRNGKPEIWICDFKSIRKYLLSGSDWNFIENIEFEFVINKFNIISDNRILFVTGQNKESLMLTDITGKQLGSFLKKKIPFLAMRPVQFVDYDSCLIFQLGVANEGAALDIQKNSFEIINITNNEYFFTAKKLLNLFDKLGQDYIREIPEINCIRGFSKINDNILLDYHYDGERFVAVSQNGVWNRMKVDINSNPSISTFCASESFDSFIRFEYHDDDSQNLVLYEHYSDEK